ncbi:MAG: HlyC/CorC family transporter [Deltaproteobacteria bacterium]|nr:HlyC/CorC family transporter [Deltaproteobacteria bacterium]
MSWLGLVAIFALILLNAYFVATEFALVAVRRSQVQLWKSEGVPGAASVARTLDRLDDAIAATQLGITLASIGLGFLGEPALADLLSPLVADLGADSQATAHAIAIGIAFTFVTFLHVVVGELAPKALALDRPGPVALICARPLLLFGALFRPLISVMNRAGNLLVRAIGVPPAGHGEKSHSVAELALLVREAGDAGQLRSDAAQMLGNLFRITDKTVADVLIPRDQVKAIPRNMAMDDMLDLVREEGFTRFPVYDGTLDNIVGVLHAKDVFYLHSLSLLVILDDALRPHQEIAPDVSLADALRLFRRERRHLAVVRGAEGKVLGIITLEDVLEQIVGAIEDEQDMEEAQAPMELS